MKEWIETLYDFTKWVNEIIKNQMSKEIVFGNSESQQATVLTNTFQFIPRQQSYSANFPQKPQISGSQTAIVVGPEGEEIFTDNQGRVKVQFYWDREGSKDDHSSCWIRVSVCPVHHTDIATFLWLGSVSE